MIFFNYYLNAGLYDEHAITKLVVTHVPKAETARRHGRELSYILPHNAVDNFAPLFSAIEERINNKSGKLGRYSSTQYKHNLFTIQI